MGYIFISYSHKDAEYVHRLQDALQKEGFEVWIDDRIDYGEEWPIVIQDQLDKCDAFILVASKNSYKSKWVRMEVTRAQRIKKPFFPLLISGSPWLTIESIQYVDVRNKSLPTEKFYEELEEVTPRKKKGAEGETVGGVLQEGGDRRAALLVSISKALSRFLTSLKSVLDQVQLSTRIVSIIVIILVLIWCGTLAMPRVFALIPTASPTATITFTPTERPTATRTLVPTSTRTKTPAATATITSTGTSTRTPTNTATHTLTSTPTFTATPLPTINADIKSRRSDYPLGVPITFLSERSTVTDAKGKKSYCNQIRTCTYEWRLSSATGALVDLDESSIYIFTFDTPGPYSLILKVCYLDTESCDTATLFFEVKR